MAQEMLDFHADKGIVAAIEMAPAGGDTRGCIGAGSRAATQ